MSNNDFIIRTLGIKEKDVDSITTGVDENGTFITVVKLKRIKMTCDFCGAPMISNGHYKKKVHSPTIRGYDGTIYYYANRYYCKVCGKTKVQNNPFSYKNFSSSFSLQISVMNYLKEPNYTIKMIADELHISKTTVNNYLDSYILTIKKDLPEWLGIDEVYSPKLACKGNSYLCVLTDGESRKIYDILESRGKRFLKDYFEYYYTLEERKTVKYVTMDMWEPYRDDAKKVFPNCIIAVDPFHFIKHLCDDFERVRIRTMNKQQYGSPSYYLLKKWNWLLKIDDIELGNEPKYNRVFKEKLNYEDIFNMLMKNFPELSKAYKLKEKFRLFVQEASYDKAVETYDEYLNDFKTCGIKEYEEFTNILINWRNEIINSFYRPYDDRKLTNAYTERINGEIRKHITISHGLGNFNRFKKRMIYALNSEKGEDKPKGFALKPKLDYSLRNKKNKLDK